MTCLEIRMSVELKINIMITILASCLTHKDMAEVSQYYK